MKFKPNHIHIKHPKRLVIIISVAVVVLAALTYGLFSYFFWNHYAEASTTAPDSLKSAIVRSLSGGDTLPQTNIDTVVKDFEKTYGSSPCDTPPLYHWQTLLPSLKASEDTCQQKFSQSLEVIKKLKTVSTFFKNEKVAADLFTATIETTKAPTDYAAASSSWQSLADSDQLPSGETFKTLRESSIEIATGISTAYASLADAVKNENKAGFDTATTSLQAAYARIDELKTSVLQKRTELIKAFISEYEKL